MKQVLSNRIRMGIVALTLICTVGLGALLVGCQAVTVLSQNQTASIVINEVVSSNKRSLIDPVFGTPDWIEIYNAGTTSVDLTGYGLSDNMNNFHKFTFPACTLEPGEYLVVYATNDKAVGDSTVMTSGFGIAKAGDFLFLTDAYYGLVQQLEVPQLATDISYARREDGTYGYAANPTPKAKNAPGIENSLPAVLNAENLEDLVISEVLPVNNDGEPWVELYNAGSHALRLENYYLSDSEINPMRWQIPACSLEAGDYVLIYLSGQNNRGDEFHTDFRLGKQDRTVILTDFVGNRIDQIQWEELLPGGIAILAGESPVYTAEPTPNAPNSTNTFSNLHGNGMDASDSIRINELLRRNRSSAADMDGDKSEWVELVNRSDEAVSLHGYFLSDDPNSLFKWALPDVTMQPHSYIIIFLSGKNRTTGELHASFRLGAGEEAVYLTCVDGMRTDFLEASEDMERDISVGRNPDGSYAYYAYPTPGYENGHGFESAEDIGFFNINGVYITEVMAVYPAESSLNDWIELYNGSKETVELGGWCLSDKEEEPDRYVFPKMSIAPGGYVTVETTANSKRQTQSTATFGVTPDGEKLYLHNANGELVDIFDTGKLRVGITAGRIEGDDSAAKVYFTTPTRGKKNDQGSVVTGYTPPPFFSEMGLYQKEQFRLSMSVPLEGASIYYTTDGSKPTTRSKRYTEPITIKSNTVVRAMAVSEGRLNSDYRTATFLFEKQHSLPVVSLMGAPDDIAVINATRDRENKPEREAFLQYFEKDGSFGTEFPLGLKAKGAGTLSYAQKSYSVHLRGGYGQSSVRYPFYDAYDFPFKEFSALSLRNSGQDWDYTRLKNSFFSRATQGMFIDAAMTRPVILYLNGSYRGIYDLDEDMNKDYLATHYGVDPQRVDIVRRNSTALAGSSDDFLDVRDMGRNGNTGDDAVFAKFSERVDVEFFTDYFIAQTYFFNDDMFNQKYWRSQDGTVKWRPVCFDQDYMLSSHTRDLIGHFFKLDGVPSVNGTTSNMDVYIGLKKNKGWRQYCVERYIELIVTQFDPDRLCGILDEMAAEIRPEMERHIKKWGQPVSMTRWERNLEKLKTALRKRPEYALEHLQDFSKMNKTEFNALVEKYRSLAKGQ